MKTEVQIDGEWFELLGVHERGVGRLYVWVATDGNPMWVYQAASDSPLPTRPAPEAKAEAEAGDGWGVSEYPDGTFYVYRSLSGTLSGRTYLQTDGSEAAHCATGWFKTRAYAESALALWREKQKKPVATLADEKHDSGIERIIDRSRLLHLETDEQLSELAGLVFDLASLLRRHIEGEGK